MDECSFFCTKVECICQDDDNFFYCGWIPTVYKEAGLDTAMGEYYRRRRSKRRCYIHFTINSIDKTPEEWKYEVRNFSVCPVYFENDDPNYFNLYEDTVFYSENIRKISEETNNDNRYRGTIISSIVKVLQNELPEYFSETTNYEILVYPKINSDILTGIQKRLFADSTIIIVGKKCESEIDIPAQLSERKKSVYSSIERILILDIPFKDFFASCLQSNPKKEKISSYGVGTIFSLDDNGLILFQSTITIPSFDTKVEKLYQNFVNEEQNKTEKQKIISYDIFKKNYLKYRNLALARQIFVILSDIYLVKLFHSPSTDVVNDVIKIPRNFFLSWNCCVCKAKNQGSLTPLRPSFEMCSHFLKPIRDKIRYNYSKKAVEFTNKITKYSQTPFYRYMSYGKIRGVQEGIRHASGEMLYGKHFLETYYTEDEVKKYIPHFEKAMETIDINTERLENKWTFTMLLPILSLFGVGGFYLYQLTTKIGEIDSTLNSNLYVIFAFLLIICMLWFIGCVLGSFLGLILRDWKELVSKRSRRIIAKFFMTVSKRKFYASLR